MDALDRGRSAVAAQAWSDAVAALAEADQAAPLEADDLERLATAAWLTGRDAESAEAWARAHHQLLARAELRRAARCAIWLGFGLVLRGEMVRAGGWMARARRVLAEGPSDLAEHGFLLWWDGFQAFVAGDFAAALDGFERAAAAGERHRDPDLAALGRVGAGRARIRLGDAGAGVALLDEVMVAVETGELSPIVVGDLYCTVLEGCQELFDLRRAQEWTEVLTGWCAAQQDLVPYRGQCLLHRAELHPLRGEAAEAEAAYRQASRWGREPQPGLALLRLAQGQTAAAEAAIRRALDEAGDPPARARLLPAQVEIALGGGDVAAARAAAGKLAQVAAGLEAPLLAATAAAAEGAVLLAEGDPRAALTALRGAWAAWRELEAPYEAARAREGIGLACRALGDQDSAALELDAARWTYQRLGAAPDLARVEALAGGPARAAGGLTAREVEVLRLVATGQTNRSIATELVLSERTVDRHVSNILTKLGVPSRAAATAWAYEHGLV
jgi:DNA-binding CsgD family transcriptional regulator